MKLKDKMESPIALRLNFVDVVCDDSLKSICADGRKVGCQFDVRLSYYRGHFLSTIDILKVLIDGQELARYMIEYNVGVSTKQVYEVKRIDSDYFEE